LHQSAAAPAIIGHRHHGSDVGGVILEATQEGAQPRAAPNGHHPRPQGQLRAALVGVHHRRSRAAPGIHGAGVQHLAQAAKAHAIAGDGHGNPSKDEDAADEVSGVFGAIVPKQAAVELNPPTVHGHDAGENQRLKAKDDPEETHQNPEPQAEEGGS